MVYNITKKTVLSNETKYAKGIIERGIGMIARNFSNFDGMVFENCNTIHTLFMRIKLDIVFIDADNRITSLHSSVPAWIPMLRDKKGVTTIELPEGTIAESNSAVGDILNIKTEINDEDYQFIKPDILNNEPETVILPYTEETK